MKLSIAATALLTLVAGGVGLAACVAQPRYVSARLLELSTGPAWMSSQIPMPDPKTMCMLRSDLAPMERLLLADTLLRSIRAYRLLIWQSELNRVASEASMIERLDVIVRGQSEALLDRAEQKMAKLEPIDGLSQLELRLLSCAA